MPAIHAEGIYKNFGGVQALRDVSLSLEENSVLGLIGPNGSGKTTLLNILAGLDRPTSGTVKFNGRRIDGLQANQIVGLGIAKTHQIPKPFLNMTARENVAVAVMYGRKRIRDTQSALAEADSTLSLLGLDGKKDALASNLTVQEKKRLELARVIGTGATVLLLDEVFTALSLDELRDSMQLFTKVRNELHFSALIVEHVMKAVLTLGERVVVLDNGEKIAEGTPDEIVHDQKVIEAYLGPEKIGT